MDKNKKKEIQLIISEDEINKRIDQIEQLDCDEDLRRFLVEALQALVRLDQLVGLKETTIARLRKIFNKKIEKKIKENKESKGKSHPRGNNKGRNGKDKYPNANKVMHSHDKLKKGDRCPLCDKGTLGDWDPGIYIRITGSPNFTATIHETEKFRCNACQNIFEADYNGKKDGKYDSKAIAILSIMKYRASQPFYRTDKLQKLLLTPMPASTQWDLCEGLANILNPLWLSLVKMASQGKLFYIDDTKGKIVAQLLENKKPQIGSKKRKGIYTTAIASVLENNHKVVLYFTGRKYAGENLDELLKSRDATEVPIVMKDACFMNRVKEHDVLEALCNVHARRRFFDLGQKFEEESNYVIELLKKIFKNEKHTQEHNYSMKDRLLYHQEHSTPLMKELHLWMKEVTENKKIEPNSGLGKAISYCLKHWKKLLAFTNIEGAPLHNNYIERILRIQVVNRKNWYYYKTEIGALVGDIILSIIITAEEAGINIFEYLVWIQENKENVAKNPAAFFPWEFQPIKNQ